MFSIGEETFHKFSGSPVGKKVILEACNGNSRNVKKKKRDLYTMLNFNQHYSL
jgi:hypothetical protein